MSIAAYTDHQTYELLDDAVDQIARHRGLSLARDDAMFSVLASLAKQVGEMIENAIAESDLGYQATLQDIADLLGINTGEAHQRYATEAQPC
jgi:hypothetical protein